MLIPEAVYVEKLKRRWTAMIYSLKNTTWARINWNRNLPVVLKFPALSLVDECGYSFVRFVIEKVLLSVSNNPSK